MEKGKLSSSFDTGYPAERSTDDCRSSADKTQNSFTSHTDRVGEKVKHVVKKFLKSLSTSDKDRSEKTRSDVEKRKIFDFSVWKRLRKENGRKSPSVTDPGRDGFTREDKFREYTSWEDMMNEVDRNLSENFNIRDKYDAIRPIAAHPPIQNYYYIHGVGLFTDKFLPDFKELKRMGLADYNMKPLHSLKGYSSFQLLLWLTSVL